MADPTHTNELDLAIPDMDSETAEKRVKDALHDLPGIETVRLMERGAWMRHRPDVITADQICEEIRRAGYRPSVFQDSTGRMGRSSQ
jgi:cation transport ATPase